MQTISLAARMPWRISVFLCIMCGYILTELPNVHRLHAIFCGLWALQASVIVHSSIKVTWVSSDWSKTMMAFNKLMSWGGEKRSHKDNLLSVSWTSSSSYMHLNSRFSETTSRKCSCNSLLFWNSAVTTSLTAWNKAPYTFSLKHNTINWLKTKSSFLETTNSYGLLKQRQTYENVHAFRLTSSVLWWWGTILKNPFNSKTVMQEVKT